MCSKLAKGGLDAELADEKVAGAVEAFKIDHAVAGAQVKASAEGGGYSITPLRLCLRKGKPSKPLVS